MTDIVKRLRTLRPANSEYTLEIIAEAADEIEKLRELLCAAGKHWLALQMRHPVQWEGAIDSAMEAACAEIEKLRELLREADPYLAYADDELQQRVLLNELLREMRFYRVAIRNDLLERIHEVFGNDNE